MLLFGILIGNQHRQSATMHKSTQGFSAIEIIVTLTLVSILTALAVPRFSEMNRSLGRSDARNQIDFDLSRARSEALANGGRTYFILSSHGTHYSISVDYLPYNSLMNGDFTIVNEHLPDRIAVSTSRQIVFDSRGFVIDEQGNPSSVTITFKSDGTKYGSATLSPTGYYQFQKGG